MFHDLVRSGDFQIVCNAINKDGPSIVNKKAYRLQQTPLHVACYEEQVGCNIIQVLIDNGSDVNAQDSEGWTPLHCATVKGRLDATLLLLSNENLDVNIENSSSTTPLQYISRLNIDEVSNEIQTQFFNVIELFMQKNCDIDQQNENGETALHQSACRQGIKTLQILIDFKADINLTTE